MEEIRSRFIKQAPDSLVAASALISTRSPHEILAVDEKFLELFGFRESELLGQSLKILQGPSTDPMVLKVAIKSIATQPLETKESILHDRAGQEHVVVVASLPCKKEGSYDVQACLLQLKNIGRSSVDVDEHTKLSATSDFGTSSPGVARGASRKSTRPAYNLRVGLDLIQSQDKNAAFRG
jgi:hypothetical protein